MAKYIYGDVELPEIPKADDPEYRYVVVAHVVMTLWCVCYTDTPWYGTGKFWNPDSDDLGRYGEKIITNTTSCIAFTGYSHTDETYWNRNTGYSSFSNSEKGFDQYPDDSNSCSLYAVVWTNHDIIGSDGTVLLAASEPVPVGGSIAPDIHPASFMAGLRMGQIVRAMRGK